MYLHSCGTICLVICRVNVFWYRTTFFECYLISSSWLTNCMICVIWLTNMGLWWRLYICVFYNTCCARKFYNFLLNVVKDTSKLTITSQYQIRKILYNKVCVLGVPIIFVNVNYSSQAPNLYSSTGYESKSKYKFTLKIYF